MGGEHEITHKNFYYGVGVCFGSTYYTNMFISTTSPVSSIKGMASFQ